MSWGLIVWTVACIGLALIGSGDVRRLGQVHPAWFAFGLMSVVWALGVLFFGLIGMAL